MPTSSLGQGTAGLEILEDVPDVDAVIVPVLHDGMALHPSAWAR